MLDLTERIRRKGVEAGAKVLFVASYENILDAVR